jgi:hypothetical protein
MKTETEIRERLEERKRTEQDYANGEFLQGEIWALEWVLGETDD